MYLQGQRIRQKGGGRVVKLRCVLGKSAEMYWAECLELGLRAEASNAKQCRRRLSEAIDAHLKTVIESQGMTVAIRPVSGYWYRKWLWEFHVWRHNRKHHKNNNDSTFSFTRRIPESLGFGLG